MIKRKNGECFKEFGVDISRKTWIKNWRMKVYWCDFYDFQILEVEKAIGKYCLTEGIDYSTDDGFLKCISNRKQYNDIKKLIYNVLGDDYEEDEEDF